MNIIYQIINTTIKAILVIAPTKREGLVYCYYDWKTKAINIWVSEIFYWAVIEEFQEGKTFSEIVAIEENSDNPTQLDFYSNMDNTQVIARVDMSKNCSDSNLRKMFKEEIERYKKKQIEEKKEDSVTK